MSKATFYEHFANKEECILWLFDAAAEQVLQTMATAADEAGESPRARLHASTRAFLDMLATHPDATRTLLVEIIGAGELGVERRDRVMTAFAAAIDDENTALAKSGAMPRFASPDDSFAIVGAVVELASRQVRLGQPADVRDLEPLIERLILGLARSADE
jgi:AcrR family transcriptional regulator